MGPVLHTEFCNGNVSAGYEQIRGFKEALSCLPDGAEKVSQDFRLAVAEVENDQWQTLYRESLRQLKLSGMELKQDPCR